MSNKNIFLIIIGGILLTFLLFLPGLSLVKKCPLGLENDLAPGRCPLYQETQQKGVCDLLQTGGFSAMSFDLALKPIWRDFLKPEIWLVIALLGLAVGLIFYRRFIWLRYIILAASVFYLGFFVWFSVCPLKTWQLMFLLKGDIISGLAAFLVFLMPVLLALVVGAIFCGWVCPLGGVQEFWWRAWRRLYFFKAAQNYFRKLNLNRWSFLKYVFLVLIILAVIIKKKLVLCGLDPFGALFGYFKNPAVWVSLIVLATLALVIFRPFCRFFCPFGALLSLLAKISIWQLKIDKQKCHGCELCEKICLLGAIDESGRISQSECFRCGECLAKCPKKAIGLQINK